MIDCRSRVAAACRVALLSPLASRRADAQSYPNGQVRLIVPTSPGGVTDTMARIVAQRLAENLKPDRHRRQPRRRQRLGRRHRGGARAAGRADPAGDVGRHHHRQPVAVQQARLQRQGVHADHRAVPRHADAGGQLQRCRPTACKELIALAKAEARHAELRLLRRRHLRASQHGGFQAAHRHRHRAHSVSRRDAGGAGAARRRRQHAAAQLQQHRGPREDGKVRILAAAGDKRAAVAARTADHRRGRRAGLLDDGVVRAVRPGQHAAGAGEQDPRRRQQGAGPAADQGILRRRTASSG